MLTAAVARYLKDRHVAGADGRFPHLTETELSPSKPRGEAGRIDPRVSKFGMFRAGTVAHDFESGCLKRSSAVLTDLRKSRAASFA